MSFGRFGALLALAGALGLSCSGKKDSGATREQLLSELRLEAQSLKVNGEKPNPKLPVRSRWTLVDAQIKDQPDNSLYPYKGTVRFKIEASTSDVDGSVMTDQFEKSFDYLYDAKLKKWR
jgi:hypothetical protein